MLYQKNVNIPMANIKAVVNYFLMKEVNIPLLLGEKFEWCFLREFRISLRIKCYIGASNTVVPYIAFETQEWKFLAK